MEVKEKSQRNKFNWFRTLKGISIVYFNYLDFVLDNNYWFIIDLFINSLDMNCLAITSSVCFVIKLFILKVITKWYSFANKSIDLLLFELWFIEWVESQLSWLIIYSHCFPTDKHPQWHNYKLWQQWMVTIHQDHWVI